jgi:hypothetical protein
MNAISLKRSFKDPQRMANEELVAELEELGHQITSGRPNQEKLGERYREVRRQILSRMK